MGACLENSLSFHTATGGMGVGVEGEQETCIFRDHISFLLNTSDLYISHFFYYIVKSWLGWILQGHRVWGDGSQKWSKQYDFSWILYLFCCSVVQSAYIS